MPPHCDSLDGPVVGAARRALEKEDVDEVLAYVGVEQEQELRDAYELAVKARTQGPEAEEVSERYLFDTAVRLHRMGEGQPFTGLKPAGLDVGPAVRTAEEALAEGNPAHLIALLLMTVQAEAVDRYNRARHLGRDARTLEERRAAVEAALGLQVWAHTLYRCATTSPHHHQHQ